MLLLTGLIELHMFFMTRKTTFANSTVSVIYRLVLLVMFLKRRQSSEEVL